MRRRYLGSATPKVCLLSIRYSVILMAAPPGLRPLHTQFSFPSLSTTASIDTGSTQPYKCHISQLSQSQDDSEHPHASVQNGDLYLFLTLVAMFPQPQGEVSIKLPIFRVVLLTLFFSFVPSNSSLLHLGCNTKHHGDS